MNDHPSELTEDDKLNAFLAAVTCMQGATERWAERSALGLNDEELAAALAYELGTAGGSCGFSQRPNINYQQAGLKIWVSWISNLPMREEPVFQGQHTIKTARRVFEINDPSDRQISLF